MKFDRGILESALFADKGIYRTEIQQMNGLIARKGAEIGVPAPSHVRLTELVTRIERGELKPSPEYLQR